eukprot:GHUV01006977.1.p1 GENE.GHUV01006977.1~~GHUV01006977.1.p1  ORF type:complete len:456 (+),score=139.45 GHUV01006977.1:2006-3373(+)
MLMRNAHAAAGSPQGVFVYRGEGAGWRSVRSTCESLQRLLPKRYTVSTLSAAELLDGSWASSAALLVMPGGADLPYCKHLNGKGNKLIKEYVRSGGSYLGLCAGAYYACSRVEFEPGSQLQVVGDRELAFFPGVARGAAYEGFDYLTESGAVAAHIQFQVPAGTALADHAQQLQRQHLRQQQQRASGGEAGQQDHTRISWCSTRDYCNGGPMFVTRQGDLDLTGLPGVTVLATYSQLAPRTCTDSRTGDDGHSSSLQDHKLQQQQQHLTTHRQSTRVQGKRRCSGSSGSQGTPDASQPVAAVRCQVGSGVAVLCGTHPELEPHWLEACGRLQEQVKSAASSPSASIPASTPPNGRSSSTRRHQQMVAAAAHPPSPMPRADPGVGPIASLPVVAMLAGAVVTQQQAPVLLEHSPHNSNATSKKKKKMPPAQQLQQTQPLRAPPIVRMLSCRLTPPS